VQERGIHKTKLRCIVITRAAADDITAWCILAVVITIVKATFVSSLYIIMLAVLYVIAMIYIVKAISQTGGDLYGSKDTIIKPVVLSFSGAYYFVLCYRSDWDSCFIWSVYGRIIPDVPKFRTIFIEKVEDVVDTFYLILFSYSRV
jgi:hypothetical protein